MVYLEEWSLIHLEHEISLSGAVEALKAAILRLPVVGGARVCDFFFKIFLSVWFDDVTCHVIAGKCSRYQERCWSCCRRDEINGIFSTVNAV